MNFSNLSTALSFANFFTRGEPSSKKSHEEWLDPIDSISAVAILTFRDPGTKLSILNHAIHRDHPTWAQSIKRYWYDCSRKDLENFATPIYYAVKWLKPHDTQNPNIKLIFKLAKKAIADYIEDTYKNDKTTKGYLQNTHLKIIQDGLDGCLKPTSDYQVDDWDDNTYAQASKDIWIGQNSSLDAIAEMFRVAVNKQKANKNFDREIAYISKTTADVAKEVRDIHEEMRKGRTTKKTTSSASDVEATKLTKQKHTQIIQARTAEELIEIVISCDDISAQNIATALQRMAGKYVMLEEKKKIQALLQQHSKKIIELISPCLNEMKPNELANTAKALAILGIRSESLFKAIATLAETKIEDFTPQDLDYTLWSFATLGLKHENLFKAITAQTEIKIEEFTPQDLVNITKTFSTLGIKHDGFYKTISANAESKIKEFNPQNLADIARTLAMHDSKQESLFKAIEKQVMEKIEGFSKQNYADITWAFTKLEISHEGILKAMTALEAKRKVSNSNSEGGASLSGGNLGVVTPRTNTVSDNGDAILSPNNALTIESDAIKKEQEETPVRTPTKSGPQKTKIVTKTRTDSKESRQASVATEEGVSFDYDDAEGINEDVVIDVDNDGNNSNNHEDEEAEQE